MIIFLRIHTDEQASIKRKKKLINEIFFELS